MKLHLGCGSRLWPDWVNIDLACGDVQMDIRRLEYPDDSAEAITAIHVFEHLYLHDAEPTLKEWRRVLWKGGVLTLELPCMDRVIDYVSKYRTADPRMVMFPLFGEPATVRGEADVHKWCWTERDMLQAVREAGFAQVWSEAPQYHVPERDMRIVAVK